MPQATASLISYGVPFRIVAETPERLQQALLLVPHATLPETSPPGDSRIFPSDRLDQLRQDLMVHVADHAPHHVFLHAGVVALHGRAIVLPGASFAGKTTLTAALVRAGATYYSDEYAVVTPDGLIEPYARDLQIRRTPGYEVQTATPVEHLNGQAGIDTVRAGLIAFVSYVPAAVWNPLPVTPGLAVLEMLRHTIPVQRTPARVLATLAALVADSRILRSQRDEAPVAARHLLTLLEDER